MDADVWLQIQAKDADTDTDTQILANRTCTSRSLCKMMPGYPGQLSS